MNKKEHQQQLDKINNDLQKSLSRINKVRKFGVGMLKFGGLLLLGVVIFVVFFSNKSGTPKNTDSTVKTSIILEEKQEIDLTNLNEFFNRAGKLNVLWHEVVERIVLFEGIQVTVFSEEAKTYGQRVAILAKLAAKYKHQPYVRLWLSDNRNEVNSNYGYAVYDNTDTVDTRLFIRVKTTNGGSHEFIAINYDGSTGDKNPASHYIAKIKLLTK